MTAENIENVIKNSIKTKIYKEIQKNSDSSLAAHIVSISFSFHFYHLAKMNLWIFKSSSLSFFFFNFCKKSKKKVKKKRQTRLALVYALKLIWWKKLCGKNKKSTNINRFLSFKKRIIAKIKIRFKVRASRVSRNRSKKFNFFKDKIFIFKNKRVRN